jgi:hypothetical protein
MAIEKLGGLQIGHAGLARQPPSTRIALLLPLGFGLVEQSKVGVDLGPDLGGVRRIVVFETLEEWVIVRRRR